MVLIDKEAAYLNRFTIGQSDSENWFQQRHGCITANNFHSLHHDEHSEV